MWYFASAAAARALLRHDRQFYSSLAIVNRITQWNSIPRQLYTHQRCVADAPHVLYVIVIDSKRTFFLLFAHTLHPRVGWSINFVHKCTSSLQKSSHALDCIFVVECCVFFPNGGSILSTTVWLETCHQSHPENMTPFLCAQVFVCNPSSLSKTFLYGMWCNSILWF